MAATRSKPGAPKNAGASGGSHPGIRKDEAGRKRRGAEQGVRNAEQAYNKGDETRQQDLQDQVNLVDKEAPEEMPVDETEVHEKEIKEEENEQQEETPNRSDTAPDGANSTPAPREETAAEAGRFNRGGTREPSLQINEDGPELMARRMAALTMDVEHEEQGYINGYFGRKHAVVRHGPRNSPKYLFSNTKGMKTTKALDNQSKDTRKANNIFIEKGKIISLRGVVWGCLKGLTRYQSLAPRNWYVGERAKRPLLRIRTRWEGLDDVLWEKYAAVEKGWQDIDIEKGEDESTDSVEVDEDLMMGGVVVLQKGEHVKKVDFAIVWCAYQCEQLFSEWEARGRDGMSETPELQPPSK